MEFYPGVLFCHQTGPVQFGLGAAMMFPAARFHERARWEELGARMADDNALGRALAPVRISEATLETLASESNWRDAIQHYMRWQKTVRWCERRLRGADHHSADAGVAGGGPDDRGVWRHGWGWW